MLIACLWDVSAIVGFGVFHYVSAPWSCVIATLGRLSPWPCSPQPQWPFHMENAIRGKGVIVHSCGEAYRAKAKSTEQNHGLVGKAEVITEVHSRRIFKFRRPHSSQTITFFFFFFFFEFISGNITDQLHKSMLLELIPPPLQKKRT